MNEWSRQPINLDELCAGKLPARILTAVGEMELTVAELEEWERSKPPIKVSVKDSQLLIALRVRVPVRFGKLFSFIVGIGAGVGIGDTVTHLASRMPFL
jgi:hypothetical protein